MKKFSLIILLIAAALLTGCAKVEPGWVAIKVNNYGSQKGVNDYPLYTGTVGYNFFTEDIYKFPTFQQLYTWTKDPKEGSEHDESLTINTADSWINFDASISYSFVAAKVPQLFVELRKDAEEITHGYIKQQVRDAFGRACTHRKTIDVYGYGRAEMLTEAKKDLQERLGDKIAVDTLTIVGNVRVDPLVQSAINAVITATQKAAEAQAKIAESDAMAHQAMKQAEGQASAILTVADAQAKANRMLSESLTSNVLEKMRIDKWDGSAPMVQGSGSPIVQLPGKGK